MTKKSSASSRREKLYRVKSSDIMLTDKMLKELKELKYRKVDLSDEDTAEVTNWEKAQIGKFYRPVKKQITIKIDTDVLEWFKQTHKKYQTFINLVCREYMLQHAVSRKRVKHKRS